MGRRSKYSAEFKQDAVSRMGQGGKTVTALAEELGEIRGHDTYPRFGHSC